MQNGKQMKPVAWAIKSDGDFTEIGFDNDLLEEVEEMYAMEGWKYEVVPLYTAPEEEILDRIKQLEKYLGFKNSGYDIISANTPRELSDEEIVNLYKETEADNGGIREFARTILKKAGEK